MSRNERPLDHHVTRALQALLAGRVPSEKDTEALTGTAKVCIEALMEALHADGLQAVRKAFAVLVKDQPWLGRLASQSPPEDDEQEAAHQEAPGKKRKHTLTLIPKELDTAHVLTFLNENEYGDARFFAAIFTGQVCYDSSSKDWYLWGGHYWQRDTTGQVRQFVSGELASLYLHAAADLNTTHAALDLTMKTLISEGVKESDEQIQVLKDEYKAVGAHMQALRDRAWNLRSGKRCKSVLEYIQVELGITSDQWDTNQWALATPNGVIDLHTGFCRDGHPTDYIRTACPTEWTGLSTPCPRFERFLQEIFEDKPDRADLVTFLQRLLGYGITGVTTDHVFPILYGEEGRNGKDTLLGTLENTLGPVVGAVSNDVFLAPDKLRSGGSATPHLTDLQGKRLVWGSETKQGDKLNVAQIKLLTGGGAISARPLYGKQFTFTPTHKLVLMTNYKPHADARDKAFWSRACLIEFSLRFVDTPQASNERHADAHLKAALKQERSGILAWLVRGCLDWQHHGLTIPSSILLATSKYREEEDRLLLFIDERCVVASHAIVGGDDLYSAYKAWCKHNQLSMMSGTMFGREMGKRYEKTRTNSRIAYQGIGLLALDDYYHAPTQTPRNEGE